jgi:hypothetical protein
VAPNAGGWRIVVIAIDVALIAISIHVRPSQRPVSIVYRKSSRLPIRVRGVARRTVCRQAQRNVVWIGGRVIIGGVATSAGIGRVVVVPVVAGVAVVRNIIVRPG